MQTYINTYIHTDIHIHVQIYVHIYIITYVHTYKLTYIQTYIQTYIHTYTYTYIHIHIQTCAEQTRDKINTNHKASSRAGRTRENKGISPPVPPKGRCEMYIRPQRSNHGSSPIPL